MSPINTVIILLTASTTMVSAFHVTTGSTAFMRPTRTTTLKQSFLPLQSVSTSTSMMESESGTDPFSSEAKLVMTPESTSTNLQNVVEKSNNKKASKEDNHKTGVFSPIVLLAKGVLGDEQVNKLRAAIISKHSDVIAAFVDTADTQLGQTVLKAMFRLADKNGNGVVEKDELADALLLLGFDWLQEKQINGILERSDVDGNGTIDLEEWLQAAPKTLRTNLVKLAKKNGGDMGLLA